MLPTMSFSTEQLRNLSSQACLAPAPVCDIAGSWMNFSNHRRKRNRVGMDILGAQHQLAAVFYPSCLCAILGSWLNPSRLYFHEKIKNKFVARGGSSSEWSSWALRSSPPKPGEQPWIHQGCWLFPSHCNSYIVCLLTKKTMETFPSMAFLPYFIICFQMFLKDSG